MGQVKLCQRLEGNGAGFNKCLQVGRGLFLIVYAGISVFNLRQAGTESLYEELGNDVTLDHH